MPLKDLLFGFKGRIRRRDWWLWGLGAAVVWGVTTAALDGVLFGISWRTSFLGGSGLSFGWAFLAWGLVSFAPILWVQVALAAKRAHDRDRGAAVAVALTVIAGLLSFVVEIADLAIGPALTDGQFSLLSGSINAATFVIQVHLLIVLGFLDGTPGPNRFGPSPTGIGGDMPDQTAKVFS